MQLSQVLATTHHNLKSQISFPKLINKNQGFQKKYTLQKGAPAYLLLQP